MPTATVLLLVDDPVLSHLLAEAFESNAIATLTSHDLSEAIAHPSMASLDIIVVDLDLDGGNDLDAMEACRQLARLTPCWIIAVGSDTGEAHKIAALDAGADDYLTKPVSIPELMARGRVALRRRQRLAPMLGDGLVQVGLLRLDLHSHEALMVEQPLGLTPKEFALLALLARNVGRVLTHRMILDQVWGPGQALDTLRTHISLLRRKLGDGDLTPKLVTVPGVGYRLLAEQLGENAGQGRNQ